MIEVRVTIEATQDLRDLLALLLDAVRGMAPQRTAAAARALAPVAQARAEPAPSTLPPPSPVAASPSGDSAPVALPPRKRGEQPRKYSPERRATIRRMLDARASRDAILAAINALPGEPVGSIAALNKFIDKVGWVPSRIWSPERDALVLQLSAEGLHNDVLFERVNALPGPPVASPAAAAQRAWMLRHVVKRASEAAPAAPAAPQAPPAAIPRAVASPCLSGPIPAPLPAKGAPLAPVETDAETALRWGAERGLDPHRLDLEAVNRKRVFHGLPPWVLRPRAVPNRPSQPPPAAS